MASRDITLCGMRQWAAVVRRIWGYPGATEDTPVSAVWRLGKMDHITSKEMTAALRVAVFLIGEDILGIKAKEIGTLDQVQQCQCTLANAQST